MARRIQNSDDGGGRSKRGGGGTSARGGRTGGGKRVGSAAPTRRAAAAPINRGGGATRQARSTISPSAPQHSLGGTPYSSYSSGGPVGGMPGGGGPQIAPVVAAPSEQDYLAGDSAYQAQLAALKGALERYTSDATLQRTNYEKDYGSGLRDLGYDEGNKAWNWDDTLTASGRAYQNQLNDFASRGMLQSQGYADSNEDLQRMLGQQYEQMATNKTNFLGELDRGTANYKGENMSSQQAARAEAIARRAAQFGL